MILLRFDIRGVAQLVAYLVWDQRVVSSSLATPTKENKGVKHSLAPFSFYTFAQNLHIIKEMQDFLKILSFQIVETFV